MTAEQALETLVTAIHQVAASYTLPPALANAVVATKATGPVDPNDLMSYFPVDPMEPRDTLAYTIHDRVRCLIRSATSKLEPGAKLVAIDRPVQPTEHPEPALLAPGLPAYVGIEEQDGKLFGSIRLPFGIAAA